jgi:hypothetical protein
MTKWSEYTLNFGTAGPNTVQGFRNLGFLQASDIPALVGKYVRVDAAQTFTNPEKAQGRANIGAIIGTDVQAFSTSLTSLAGLTTAADRMAYTTASDTWAVTTLTSYARTLLDDVDAATARTTLGLGTMATQAASAVAITGGSITGITDLAIADGGTGASTAANARTNLGLGTAATVNTGTASGDVPLLQTGGVLAPARLGTGSPSAANFLRGDGVWSTAAFSGSYESAQQTITSAGGLTLAHGLGVKPKIMFCVIQCTTAQEGYSIGDEVPIGFPAGVTTGNAGIAVIPDATNISIRFGSAASVFYVPNRSTGVTANLTNANWRLVVRAYA